MVLDERAHEPLAESERVLLAAWRGHELAPHITWVGADDQQSAYLAFSRHVRRPDGSLLGVLVVAHDVSDIVRSRRLRDDFLRIASHELRGPLTPLVGHLDLLSEETKDSLSVPAKERLSIVQESVERLVDRVTELLHASDVEPSLALAPADIADVVARAAAGHVPKAASRGIDISLELPESAVASVDESQLAEAIGHVIDNAIKFSPDNGFVDVECRTVAGIVEISVHDGGPGIRVSDRERVFERFYRTEHAHKNAIQGFGLGLPAARAILSAHGGLIRISGRKGSGTTATLEVPVRI
nr:HAMP domain-containing sensor histidine kinase [Microbacterium halimionae]